MMKEEDEDKEDKEDEEEGMGDGRRGKSSSSRIGLGSL